MLQKSPEFPHKTCPYCISSQTQIRNARDARDDQTQGEKTEGNGRVAAAAAAATRTQWSPGLRFLLPRLLPRQDDEEAKTEWARDRERESDGWMRDGWGSSHPLFILNSRFILVATVVATFYHSPKKEKAVFFLFYFSGYFAFFFFLFQLNFSSSVFLFMRGFLSFLIKFLLWLTLLHAVVVGEVPVQVRGRGTQGREPKGVPKPQENARVQEPCLMQTTFFWFRPFFLHICRKEIFPWEHGNI